MKTKHTSTSINLLYFLSNFSLVMLSIFFLVAIAFIITIYTGNFDNNISYTVPFPVKVDYLNSGNLLLNNQDINVELIDASARLKILNPPAVINRLTSLIMICVTLFSILFTVIFRKFIKNVRDGKVFTVENINLLKLLSYGLVVAWLFQAIIMRGAYFYVANKLEFKDTSLRVDFFQYSSILIIALVIWMLAHIFLKGVRLQQEKDLTI